jgi:hypothetical protein
MDNLDKFMESLSLDPEGLSKQFLSFAAFFNILAAAVTGFLVLLVYLISSGKDKRDRNLYMVIPVLCVLMAVMMRVSGPQIISFFGVFGILSVIRFRSDITDQKGITFILFAVIEGVIVGVNAYLLAALSWVVVGGAILIGRYFFSHRTIYRLTLGFPGIATAEGKEAAVAWFEARGVGASCGAFRVESGISKRDEWQASSRAEYSLFPRDEKRLIDLMPKYAEEMKEKGIEVEFKRFENN